MPRWCERAGIAGIVALTETKAARASTGQAPRPSSCILLSRLHTAEHSTWQLLTQELYMSLKCNANDLIKRGWGEPAEYNSRK